MHLGVLSRFLIGMVVGRPLRNCEVWYWVWRIALETKLKACYQILTHMSLMCFSIDNTTNGEKLQKQNDLSETIEHFSFTRNSSQN